MITEAMGKIKAARLLLKEAQDMLDAAGARMISVRYDRDDGVAVHLCCGLETVANAVDVQEFSERAYKAPHRFIEQSFKADGIEYFQLKENKNAVSD